MKTRTGIVIIVAIALGGPAWAEPDDANQTSQQMRLELDLVDGSHIIGVPKIESVPVQTSYARMDVPLKQLINIKMGDDHETASIDLRNGDKIKGVISLAPIKLKTVFGKVFIGIEHIKDLRVVLVGGALPDKRIPADATIFNEHHYLLIPAKLGWHDAKKACEQMGGHLVTITSEEEDRFVVSLSKPLTSTEGGLVWIGCSDEAKEGDWQWVDGSKVKYTGWNPGEPNDRSHTENYGVIFFAGGRKGGGGWGDAPYPYPAIVGYICEWDH